MTVTVQKEPPILRIQLNLPSTLNALTLNTGRMIGNILKEAENNPQIKIIILESLIEKAFSVGIDLNEFYTNDTLEYRHEFLNVWNNVADFPKPIIVSVHGYVFGGGLELALMGDILIAADNTIFSQPELSLGTIPGTGATQRLPRRIGVSRATELILTGRRIDAYTALNWGLVSQVVSSSNLCQVVMDTAHLIAAKPLSALIKAKSALRTAEELPLSSGLSQERSLFLSTFMSEDQKEGFQAFLQKRPPIFRN